MAGSKALPKAFVESHHNWSWWVPLRLWKRVQRLRAKQAEENGYPAPVSKIVEVALKEHLEREGVS